MGAPPIVPEHGQQFGRQHDIAIFVALALVNPNDHALAINRSGFEADGFGDFADRSHNRRSEARGAPRLSTAPRKQATSSWLKTVGSLRFSRLTAGRNIVPKSPRSLEGNGVEKPQGGDRNNDRAGCEMSLLRPE